MLEINAVYFILLAEGFGLSLLVLIGWVLIALIRRRRKNRAVTALALQFKNGARERSVKTESFLQAVYGLEGDDLRASLANIEHCEEAFFQQMIESLERGRGEQIGSLDSSLEKLIESYKCLQPRADDSEQEALQALGQLRGENEALRGELSLVKQKMSDMISEFGNMFGGGKDHELALDDVKQRVAAIQAENEIDIVLESQK